MFTDAAIQAVPTPKVLFRPPPRAAQGMAGGLTRPASLDRRVPHSSTLPRRRKDLVVAIPCRRPRGGPPHPVVDGTGPKVPGEGERKVRRHGAETRRARREVHLGVDADGREVRAVEVTDHRRGDGEIVPGLPARLPEAERIAVLGGGGACDTRAVHEASIPREADSVVPPRRNGRPWKARTAGAGERDETPRAVRRLGRRLWKKRSGLHRRSLAGTAVSRLERPGERLSARDPARQVAEVQIRRAIPNTFNGLGTPRTVALA